MYFGVLARLIFSSTRLAYGDWLYALYFLESHHIFDTHLGTAGIRWSPEKRDGFQIHSVIPVFLIG